MADEGKIEQAVAEAAREEEGRLRLSCAEALQLATRLGVTPAAVGAACDRKKIKIGGCQLGCFR
jgi:hypothetical protein